MNKKCFWKISTILPTLCLAVAPTIINLTSCATNVVLSSIRLPNSTFTVNTHEFSIPVYFNFEPNGEVEVKLKNNNPNISLASNTIVVEDGSSNLNFVIDQSVLTSFSFNFDIEFVYKNANLEEHKYTIFNVLVYYTNEEIIERDDIRLESKYTSSINEHVFKYICYFPTKPISNLIHVSISNKSSNLFELAQEDYAIQDGDIPYIEIELSLDVSVFKKSFFGFDMTLSFVNSYSKSQEETFYGCSFLYDVVKGEEVPVDYLNLVPMGSQSYKLTGLKPNVSPLEGGKYKVLKIPDNVDIISENAFSNKQWFSGIKRIIISSSVNNIGNGAFSGCDYLTEFDISAYGDKEPLWASIPGRHFFDTESFKSVGGFVWADKFPDLNELHHDMVNWGLPEAWSGYNSDMYTSKDDFTFKEDDQTEITGLNQDRLENFKHYKVIRVPDFVKNISDDSFNYLKENPYESPSSTPETPIYETRELVLGEDFDGFSCNCFQNAGFSGNILLYCNNATSISDGAFSNMQNYGWPGILGVVTKPINLIFNRCADVDSISDYAFNFVPVANDTISFKKTISTFGDYSFQGNQFKKIVFTDNITNVGLWSFANVFVQPPSEPCLNYIDLSCYYKIVNPEASKYDQTRIPRWFEVTDYAFEGSCCSSGTVRLSKEVMEEIQDKDDPDEWIDMFLQKHKIPLEWKLIS